MQVTWLPTKDVLLTNVEDSEEKIQWLNKGKQIIEERRLEVWLKKEKEWVPTGSSPCYNELIPLFYSLLYNTKEYIGSEQVIQSEKKGS